MPTPSRVTGLHECGHMGRWPGRRRAVDVYCPRRTGIGPHGQFRRSTTRTPVVRRPGSLAYLWSARSRVEMARGRILGCDHLQGVPASISVEDTASPGRRRSGALLSDADVGCSAVTRALLSFSWILVWRTDPVGRSGRGRGRRSAPRIAASVVATCAVAPAPHLSWRRAPTSFYCGS